MRGRSIEQNVCEFNKHKYNTLHASSVMTTQSSAKACFPLAELGCVERKLYWTKKSNTEL